MNAVLGDDSWVARFGVAPGDGDDEDLRLRVHLEHVEALLRAHEPAALTDVQRAERARNLDRLRAYIERGEFPRNHTVAGRRPHFIDEDGRICAVGFLIEQSAGREVAERINAAHEWDYIPEIRGIEAWVAASGLTVTELAMIQPSYHWRPQPMPPPPPPPDEGTRQRQLVLNAFDASARAVQGCADHWEPWRTSVSVTVTVSRWGSTVSVHAGRSSLRFRRCVQREVERRVAHIAFWRRVTPMTVTHSFTLDPPEDDGEIVDDDGGWAQPPPS